MRKSLALSLKVSAFVLALSMSGQGALAAAAKRPDLTGLWANTGRPTTNKDLPVTQQNVPLRPEARAKVDDYNSLVAPKGETPGGVCLGTGTPSLLLGAGGYPMEIIQRPEQITVIFESHGETRRVYFGDRNAAEEDRIPGRNGYTSGHWEGDVLVLETGNLVEQVDQIFAHSDKAKVVERYYIDKAEKGPEGERILVVDMVMTDPEFYTEPAIMKKKWVEVPNGRLLPYECAEEVWHKRLEELAAEHKAAAKAK